MKRSMVREVAAAIRERGPCTAESIAPLFPDVERRKLHQAVRNARQYGYLTLIEGQQHRGYGGGSDPGVYAVAGAEPVPERRRIASVWELGAA